MDDRLPWVRIVFGVTALAVFGLVFLAEPDPREPVAASPVATPDGAPPARLSTLARPTPPPVSARPSRPEAAPIAAEEPETDPDRWRGSDIEDLKQAIYALEIDTVEDLDLLEQFVHTDTDDVRELWDTLEDTGWQGVDDWKRDANGFVLERADDDTMLFVPDEQTQALFTFFESVNVYEFDPDHQAFIHRVDYYGKPILNLVKFLREDVLVMATVSGRKVDLQIYEQPLD